MRKAVLFLTVALFGLAPALSHAADATPIPAASAASFTDAQRAEIESIIKDYLTDKHPEVMAEGLQNLQKHEQEDADAKTKAAVGSAKDRVYNDAKHAHGRQSQGNVTVVEFFDYQCGYCKMSEDSIERMAKEDKNIKFIFKEFPILGPASRKPPKPRWPASSRANFRLSITR